MLPEARIRRKCDSIALAYQSFLIFQLLLSDSIVWGLKSPKKQVWILFFCFVLLICVFSFISVLHSIIPFHRQHWSMLFKTVYRGSLHELKLKELRVKRFRTFQAGYIFSSGLEMIECLIISFSIYPWNFYFLKAVIESQYHRMVWIGRDL